MLKIQDNMIIKWRDDFDGSMLDRIGYGLEEALGPVRKFCVKGDKL